MHKLALIAALALSAAATLPAFAADAMASAPMSTQQSKMKSCNADATGKTGADRKAFMKTCLSGGSAMAAAPATPMTQQDKMKKCNADATGKKGDDRKTFMKSCLSA